MKTLFTNLFFNPKELIRNWAALPFFIRNYCKWISVNKNNKFKILFRNLIFTTHDRFRKAGNVDIHYFSQDLWAAQYIYKNGIKLHVDVASRIDGFISHILPYCYVKYIDLRPIDLENDNFEYIRGSVLNLPFKDNTIANLSCLHVIEHIGLGRYGDPVDPEGHLKAAAELARVLSVNGTLLLATPVGRERICFDAHRIFNTETIISAFPTLTLREFSLITDSSLKVIVNADFLEADKCRYGCGLFRFEKLADTDLQ